MDSRRAIELLQTRISEGEELRNAVMAQSDAAGWANKVEHSVRRVLQDHDEEWIRRFLHVPGSTSSYPDRRAELARAAVQRTLIRLQSLIDILEEAEQVDPSQDSHPVPAAVDEHLQSKEIFLVHGHDEGSREAVARFLERLGLAPVVLHEHANRGQTIIEKVEAHSRVGFAVVLLTPDDEGNARGEAPRPRARQNVILELGYFLAKLERSRVCALLKGDIEVPSDFGGVLYVKMDGSDAWKMALGRELRAAGYKIDWNLVMQ